MVVIGILGLLVGILAVAVIPRLVQAKRELEIKQLGDIRTAFQNLSIGQGVSARLQRVPLKDTQGRAFYNQGFKTKLFEADLLGKLISLNSPGDARADTAVIDDPNIELEDINVSYTAPKSQELMTVMNARGNNRTVLLTFNARNWHNYQEYGTIVQWSDAETAQYLLREEAEAGFQIDRESWDNNPKDIIGNKKPFDKTFE